MTYVFGKNINGTTETGIVDITKNPPELICLCDETQSKLLLQALNFSSKQVVSGMFPSDEEVALELIARFSGQTSRGTKMVKEGFADGVIWLMNEIKKRGKLR